MREPLGEWLQSVDMAVVIQALCYQQAIQLFRKVIEPKVFQEFLGGIVEPGYSEIKVADQDGVHQDVEPVHRPQPAVPLKVS